MICSIFVSLFLSVEYVDGTMRNKIIAGHKRAEIYLASLIVNVVSAMALCASYLLANLVIGIPLIGPLRLPWSKTLCLLTGSALMVVALCAVFTMVSLLIQSKGIAPVVCIVTMFLSIAFVNEVQRILDEPQYWYDGTVNAAYVDGCEREVLEFLYRALPAGQGMQYAGRQTGQVGQMTLYAAALTVVTTGVGVFCFQRKEIR